jgi:imidazolonepropionase-like amidohydrolase
MWRISVQHVLAEVLIPGRGDPIDHGVVVLDGPSIVYAGASSAAPVPASDDVVDEVAAVMPGLWDSHAHLIGLRDST